jgi:hypothetical protein
LGLGLDLNVDSAYGNLRRVLYPEVIGGNLRFSFFHIFYDFTSGAPANRIAFSL